MDSSFGNSTRFRDWDADISGRRHSSATAIHNQARCIFNLRRLFDWQRSGLSGAVSRSELCQTMRTSTFALGLLLIFSATACEDQRVRSDSKLQTCWNARSKGGIYSLENFRGVVIGSTTLVIASEACPGFRLQVVEFSPGAQIEFDRVLDEDRLGVRGISGAISIKPMRMIENRVLEVSAVKFRKGASMDVRETDRLIDLIRQPAA